jgi:hypothetical protein
MIHNKNFQLEIQSIKNAPKDGREILVYFKHIGWKSVMWIIDNWEGGGSWCVDDGKHAALPVRGYLTGDDTHWAELPPQPESIE